MSCSSYEADLIYPYPYTLPAQLYQKGFLSAQKRALDHQ
jgi:hypothetical protein